MKVLSSGAAAAAFALGCMSVAPAASCTMGGMTMSHVFTPHCTAKTGPVVWYMASSKMYFLKGSTHYGKGMGTYVCRATAVARGGHPGTAGTMGGSHGTMGGSHGMAMPPTQTMRPRPMSSSPSSSMPGSMPQATPGPGLPNSTNAAPGSQGTSPRPMSSGNPMSGNQGNTGAPGAGGQVPNNPASSSNSNPNPSPSPHP
jgi:hypothetical protein